MQVTGIHVALYLSQEGEHAQEGVEQAEAYCKEHGYHLWKGGIYQNDEPHIALDWVREVMNVLAIHTLLIPSLEHIHPNHIGYVLKFLIEAQEANVEVVCLNPAPTRLSHFTLAVVPLTQEQQATGAVTLPDIVSCLRFR